MFDFNNDGTIILKAKKGHSKYVIPENALSITSGTIADFAFINVAKDKFDVSFAVGSKITNIGNYTFYKCEFMTNIDFTNANLLQSIGAGSFAYCYSLTSVTFPRSLKRFIGYGAFCVCKNLTNVVFPDGSELLDLSSGTFYATPLTKFRLPSKCVTLNAESFSVTKIQEFTIENDINGAYHVFNGSLFINNFSHLVVHRKSDDFVVHSNTKIIGYLAIGGCTGNLVVPKQITKFIYLAFYDFRGKSITLLSPIQIIQPRMFENCYYLEKIVFFEGTEIIQQNAFRYSKRIKSIYLPYTLREFSLEGLPPIHQICFYGNVQILNQLYPLSFFQTCIVGIEHHTNCNNYFFQYSLMCTVLVIAVSHI